MRSHLAACNSPESQTHSVQTLISTKIRREQKLPRIHRIKLVQLPRETNALVQTRTKTRVKTGFTSASRSPANANNECILISRESNACASVHKGLKTKKRMTYSTGALLYQQSLYCYVILVLIYSK